jgi:hypothetical protein
MNSSQSRYIRSRGKILGPFSVEQLQLLRDRGQLHRFHEVSEDRLTWVTAASLSDLFPPEAPPPAVAAQSFSRPTDVSLAAMSPPGLVGYQTNASASESVRDGWHHVRTGLGLLLLSNYIWLGGVAVVLLGFLLLFAEGAATSAKASSVHEEIGVLVSMGARFLLFVVLWVLIQVATTILQLVGHGFCLMVAPRRDSGVKALAIAVFVLAVTSVVLSVLTRMASFTVDDALIAGGSFHAFVYLLDVAAFCLLLFFLRSIALAVGQKALARNLMVLLASWGGFLVAAVVLFSLLLLAVLDQHGGIEEKIRLIGPFAFFIVAMLGCIGLALYVWFLVVLHQTRRALGHYLSGRPEDSGR